ncbi:hypothetical protein EXS71_00625 [Candidatus Uhrbacteria bacterium]|nr:hypothetical protein [Candidatus Uhrbacteria bacterium]
MNLTLNPESSHFLLNDERFTINLPGQYNVMNALAALAVCQALKIDLPAAGKRLTSIERVPGRFEKVNAGQSWQVVIDYAPEPESIRRVYETLELIPHKRIIHVLGSCGGGRDAARQPILGRLAGQNADLVVVTNEDPYDDDPEKIIDRIIAGAEAVGKKLDQNLFRVVDRKEAILKAMQLAESEDIVLLTGKGCEPWMCVANGKKIAWNEHEVAFQAIQQVLKTKV